MRSPEMERRIKIYKEWQDEYGDIIVQLNVEDTAFGVAEYVVEKLGVETIELKWGQGAKCIGGEIKIRDLDRAIELQKRGYIVTPNPSNPAVRKAFESGGIKEFERHSRLGFIDEEEFLRTVEYLRRTVGVKRVTLKTGAYGYPELAMAIKWSSKARVDLVTIDGSGGGTGMSPWRMMEEWGIPTFYLQCHGLRVRQASGDPGRVDPRPGHGRRLLHRRPHLQGPGHGRPLLQGRLHGPRPDDPGLRGSNIEGVVGDGGRAGTVEELPSRGQEIRRRRRRRSSSPTPPSRRSTATRMDDMPARRGGHLHLRRQAADRPHPVHGRRAQLPPRHA